MSWAKQQASRLPVTSSKLNTQNGKPGEVSHFSVLCYNHSGVISMSVNSQVDAERLFYVHSKILNNIFLGANRDWIREQMSLADVAFGCNLDRCQIIMTGLKRAYYCACGESDATYFQSEYSIKNAIQRLAEEYEIDYHLFYHNVTKEICLVFSARGRSNEAAMAAFARNVHETVENCLLAAMPGIRHHCAIVTVVSRGYCSYEDIAPMVIHIQGVKDTEYFAKENTFLYSDEICQQPEDDSHIFTSLFHLEEKLNHLDEAGAIEVLREMYLHDLTACSRIDAVDAWISAMRVSVHRWISLFGIHPDEIGLEQTLRIHTYSIEHAYQNATECIHRGMQLIGGKHIIGMPIVQEAVRYIDTHYRERITLDTLGRHLAVNPAYLSRCFSRQMQIPFTQYVNMLRVEHARQQLHSSHKSIRIIAEEAGFSSVNHFYKVFRQQTGFSPNQYRDQFYNRLLPQK